MQYDHFSIYGFKVEYPKDWRVELKPNSEKKAGEVAFQSPEKNRISVFWGALEEAEKTFASLEEHVKRTIEKVKKSRGVSSVEVVEQKELEINGHRAIFTHLKATSIQSFIVKRREISQELWSSHLYCQQTSRYFVVYGSPRSNEKLMEHTDVFKHMQKSFRCHTK